MIDDALREELDLERLLDLLRVLAEVTLRLERPLRVGDDPVLETLDVERDSTVDLLAPGRDSLALAEEVVERLAPEVTGELDRGLAVAVVGSHEDADEVVRLRTGGAPESATEGDA